MQQTLQLKLLPSEAASDSIIKEYIARATGRSVNEITGFRLLRRSIDARGHQPHILLSLLIFVNEPPSQELPEPVHFPRLPSDARRVMIIGAGPAGLFAALRLIQKGICPIVLERGKDVRSRRRDLALLNKEGIIDPDSNYCFGEGGAGTYSDGKLYTRSNKRGDIGDILRLFVQFGADHNILWDAHPHIGTNKLPGIISAMQQQILDSGGQFHFGKRVVEFELQGSVIKKVRTADGDNFEGEAVILATGHSARDIFHLLHNRKIIIYAKPFALGVRVEHPQDLIDTIQYGTQTAGSHIGGSHIAGGRITGGRPPSSKPPSSKSRASHPRAGQPSSSSIVLARSPFLPAASYSLVEQVGDRGVFSFCMCPGGIIAPASTADGELVVNGWSPSKRNNPYANSGIVVSIEERDIAAADKAAFQKHGPLAGLFFQQNVERKAFEAGGGKFVAPAQRMADFVSGRHSTDLPSCSYLPGIRSAGMEDVLPPFVLQRLQEGFKGFGKKMRGYFTNEAVLVATESRTSSPVRIPRDPGTLRHPQISNLYPCGEGAGYAGGIVSAAMDGQLVAERLSGHR